MSPGVRRGTTLATARRHAIASSHPPCSVIGRPRTETLAVAGSPALTRSTSSYLPTGQPNTRALTGGGGTASLAYSYDAGGLPSKIVTAGAAGGNWQSIFGYDNLQRLTSWQTGLVGQSTNDVTYKYDSDGNLTQRSWTGETVNYTSQPANRLLTVAVTRGGTSVRNDNYTSDVWGRTTATPAVTLTYNELDEIVSATERATGQVDFVRRDGMGGRLVTGYGTAASGQLLYTLDDLYTFKTGSGGTEERCRLKVNNTLIGELVRTADVPTRSATFYLTDNVGSVAAEGSPSSGAVTMRTRRDPFGNLSPTSQGPFLSPEATAAGQDGSGRLGFGDHDRDPAWSLVDMNARAYNPQLGRFLSPDPILANPFDRNEHNAFAYVRNLPTAVVDATGLCGDDMNQDTQDGNGGVCGTPVLPSWKDIKNAGKKGGKAIAKGAEVTRDAVVDTWEWATGDDGPSPPKPALVSTAGAQATQTSTNATNGSNQNLRAVDPSNGTFPHAGERVTEFSKRLRTSTSTTFPADDWFQKGGLTSTSASLPPRATHRRAAPWYPLVTCPGQSAKTSAPSTTFPAGAVKNVGVNLLRKVSLNAQSKIGPGRPGEPGDEGRGLPRKIQEG